MNGTDVEEGAFVSRGRAAQYLRMSTEHQKYSDENQKIRIAQYAKARKLEIVRTYEDLGKSGLKIAGRPGLLQLIEDVQTGDADFDVILIYDVSRWGRFQDADESAFYEFICRRAGFQVEYCAELFENDSSTISTIFKSVKRAMAAEYSRELSAKVFAGQSLLTELGFRQGGEAGYGLRRMLVDQHGKRKRLLGVGEWKNLITDRVIIVPGPKNETKVVCRIFALFVEDELLVTHIANRLNKEKIPYRDGRKWNYSVVGRMLRNENYIGNNVFNKTSTKLQTKLVENPPEKWIRAEGVFEPIVSKDIFYRAQDIIRVRSRRLSRSDALAQLQVAYETHDNLTAKIIDDEPEMPSASWFRQKFGTLAEAYRHVGYTPHQSPDHIHVTRKLRDFRIEVVDQVLSVLESSGGAAKYIPETGLIETEYGLTLEVKLVRFTDNIRGQPGRWIVRFQSNPKPDIAVVARMTPNNDEIQDFYIFPQIGIDRPNYRMAENNGSALDVFRSSTLDPLYLLVRSK